ncbi:tyrosine-protein phosphatase [Flexithrix dorotheae]|uniref:tyrosine-protein phosphatase n=1 Tax=Flexithrix dorotheae TaxID=70993 RepID=UPI00037F954D|nr:tyrosine-protein phosphatase [Flexithrix dorotheae]
MHISFVSKLIWYYLDNGLKSFLRLNKKHDFDIKPDYSLLVGDNVLPELHQNEQNGLEIHLPEILKTGDFSLKELKYKQGKFSLEDVASTKNENILQLNSDQFRDQSFFELIVDRNKPILLKQRLIQLDGTCNFRDLGGYFTREGRKIKWGKVFRADHLGKLSKADLKKLSDLNFKTVIDLRSQTEMKSSPDRLPSSVKHHIHLNIAQGNHEKFIKKMVFSGRGDLLDGKEILKDIYEYFVTEASEQFTKIMEILSDEKNLPLVFHCTAGKDRTGFAAAIFLKALGVPEKTIFKDYLLSNFYRTYDNEYILEKGGYFLKRNVMEPFLFVDKSYLENSFLAIKEKYEGWENYFENELKMGKDKMVAMRKIYLQ